MEFFKSIVFWDMTPCSPLSFNRRFGGTYRLHLQGRRNRFSKPASKQAAGGCTYFFDPEDGGDVPPKGRLKLNGLHGVISQKTILLKNSIVLHLSTARQQLACVLYRLHGDSYWTVRWWGNASGQ
jgi:hypothetical protein